MHRKNYYKYNKDKGEFWKKIGSIGVAQERNRLPWEVVNDGMVSKEPNVVLEKWYGRFKDLLNPTEFFSHGLHTHSNNLEQ